MNLQYPTIIYNVKYSMRTIILGACLSRFMSRAAFSQVRNVFRVRKTLFRGWLFGEMWVYALIREKFSQVRYLFLLYPWSYFPIFELNSSLINKPIYEYSLTILRGAWIIDPTQTSVKAILGKKHLDSNERSSCPNMD